jgi:hypothetical protein
MKGIPGTAMPATPNMSVEQATQIVACLRSRTQLKDMSARPFFGGMTSEIGSVLRRLCASGLGGTAALSRRIREYRCRGSSWQTAVTKERGGGRL